MIILRLIMESRSSRIFRTIRSEKNGRLCGKANDPLTSVSTFRVRLYFLYYRTAARCSVPYDITARTKRSVSLSVFHLFFFVENNQEKTMSVLREGSGYDDFSAELPGIGETAASTGQLCTRGTTRPTDIRSYIRGNIAMERDMGTRRRRRRGPRADSL